MNNAFLQYERSNQTLGMRKGINLAARAAISRAKFQRQAYEKNGKQTMESEWRKGKLKNYRRQSLVFKYKYPVDLPVCFVRG